MGQRPGQFILLPERDWLLSRICGRAGPDIAGPVRAELEGPRCLREPEGDLELLPAPRKLTFKKKACTPPKQSPA